jgi:CheY-like chemotaxis protein
LKVRREGMSEVKTNDDGGEGLRRVLVVEDDEARCAWFREKLEGRRLDVTCDVPTALAWLAERDYEAIMLDHDLADEHYFSNTPDDERTGYAVARWLADNPTAQRDALIVIHSLNYTGARRMLDALRDAGRDAEHIPFHHLQMGFRI